MKDRENKRIVILTAQYAISLYLFVLFVIYPFYIHNGYYDIDQAKYEFLKYATGIGLLLIVVACVIQLIMKRIPPQLIADISAVDICVMGYMLANLLSYAFAINKEQALWGQRGWHMGLATTIAFATLYFLISRFYLGSKYIIPMILVASEGIFMLGILNRFGIWPIPIGIEYEHSYLSTLGNLGWYSSCIAVIAPLGVCLFIIRNKASIDKKVLLALYVFTVFVTGISQGGDSIFVFFAVLLLGSMFVASLYEDGLKNWLLMLIMWCLATQLVHIIRIVWPDAYGYDSDNFCGRFNNSFTSLWILIPVLLVYAIVLWKKVKTEGWISKIMRFIPVVFVVSGIIIFAIAIIYSDAVGINSDAAELGLMGKLFFWNSSWGGYRGTTMNIGLNIWLEQDWKGKLFGVGPDCFAYYTVYSEQYSAIIDEAFQGAILTNAHNEFLTNLANLGVLGVATFYGMLIAYMYRMKKYWKSDMRVVAVALCLICYNGYNMLNYAELLNYPFYIVLLALGETWMKLARCRKSLVQ